MRSLQCARAFAAILVVYFHSVLQLRHIGPDDITDINVVFPLFGKSGVDVFFVLSGLLIWRSTQNVSPAVTTFYTKRLLRIVPLYWILTVSAATLALVIPSALRSTRFDLYHLMASLIFLPWPNPASHGSAQDLITPVIVPGWTLNFEVFFYAIFGLCLVFPLRLRPLFTAAVFAIAIGLVIQFRQSSMIVGFYEPSLISEFMVGLFIGYLLENILIFPFWLAVLGFIFSMALLILCDIFLPATNRLLISGFPAGLLLYSLAAIETGKRWPALPWLVLIGDATYSIYLTHIFVLAGLRILLASIGFYTQNGFLQLVFILCSMALCISTGLTTYLWIERPIGRSLRATGFLGRSYRRTHDLLTRKDAARFDVPL